MTDARILQIIREEIAYENNLIFEGVNSYTPINGYRNNQLIVIQLTMQNSGELQRDKINKTLFRSLL